MAAMGLGMFDPVELMKQNIIKVGGRALPVPGMARVASVLNFLMDSLISLAVLLIAIAIGLMNSSSGKEKYRHHTEREREVIRKLVEGCKARQGGDGMGCREEAERRLHGW